MESNWRAFPIHTETERFYQAVSVLPVPQTQHERTRMLLWFQEIQKKKVFHVSKLGKTF